MMKCKFDSFETLDCLVAGPLGVANSDSRFLVPHHLDYDYVCRKLDFL